MPSRLSALRTLRNRFSSLDPSAIPCRRPSPAPVPQADGSIPSTDTWAGLLASMVAVDGVVVVILLVIAAVVERCHG